jgi:hypothetical protein
MLNGNPNQPRTPKPNLYNRGPLAPGHADPQHMSGNQQLAGRMAPQPNRIGLGGGTNTTPRTTPRAPGTLPYQPAVQRAPVLQQPRQSQLPAFYAGLAKQNNLPGYGLGVAPTGAPVEGTIARPGWEYDPTTTEWVYSAPAQGNASWDFKRMLDYYRQQQALAQPAAPVVDKYGY